MSNLKVFVLMAGLTALFGALGGFIGGQAGMMVALVFAALMNVAMYWGSAKMVLRMYRARVVTPAEAPELYAMVDTLRRRAGLPMPTGASSRRTPWARRSPGGRTRWPTRCAGWRAARRRSPCTRREPSVVSAEADSVKL